MKPENGARSNVGDARPRRGRDGPCEVSPPSGQGEGRPGVVATRQREVSPPSGQGEGRPGVVATRQRDSLARTRRGRAPTMPHRRGSTPGVARTGKGELPRALVATGPHDVSAPSGRGGARTGVVTMRARVRCGGIQAAQSHLCFGSRSISSNPFRKRSDGTIRGSEFHATAPCSLNPFAPELSGGLARPLGARDPRESQTEKLEPARLAGDGTGGSRRRRPSARDFCVARNGCRS